MTRPARHRPAVRAVLEVTALTGVLVLSGCGWTSASGPASSAYGVAAATGATGSAGSPTTSSPAPPRAPAVYAAARDLALAADSARVDIVVVSDGVRSTRSIVGLIDGTNQEYRASTPSEGSVTVRTVAGKAYVQGDRAFWSSSGAGAQAAALAGTWVSVSPSDAAAIGAISIRSVLEQTFAVPGITGLGAATARVTPGDVDGVAALSLDDPRVDGTGSMTVTSAAPNRLLTLEVPADSVEEGSYAFSQWDEAPLVKAPAAALAVDPT